MGILIQQVIAAELMQMLCIQCYVPISKMLLEPVDKLDYINQLSKKI